MCRKKNANERKGRKQVKLLQVSSCVKETSPQYSQGDWCSQGAELHHGTGDLKEEETKLLGERFL